MRMLSHMRILIYIYEETCFVPYRSGSLGPGINLTNWISVSSAIRLRIYIGFFQRGTNRLPTRHIFAPSVLKITSSTLELLPSNLFQPVHIYLLLFIRCSKLTGTLYAAVYQATYMFMLKTRKSIKTSYQKHPSKIGPRA
jgi:hypothetical protein